MAVAASSAQVMSTAEQDWSGLGHRIHTRRCRRRPTERRCTCKWGIETTEAAFRGDVYALVFGVRRNAARVLATLCSGHVRDAPVFATRVRTCKFEMLEMSCVRGVNHSVGDVQPQTVRESHTASTASSQVRLVAPAYKIIP